MDRGGNAIGCVLSMLILVVGFLVGLIVGLCF